jgi:hypothetical protein
MVTSSVMILALAPDVADESNLLLHYDYERGKEIYPEAHLQVCASSDAWREAGRRLDGKERLLERSARRFAVTSPGRNLRPDRRGLRRCGARTAGFGGCSRTVSPHRTCATGRSSGSPMCTSTYRCTGSAGS